MGWQHHGAFHFHYSFLLDWLIYPSNQINSQYKAVWHLKAWKYEQKYLMLYVATVIIDMRYLLF